MSVKRLALPLAVGLVSLIGLAATAHAAPAGLPGGVATLNVETAAPFENVHWFPCWRGRYLTECWRPAPRVYSYYYVPRTYWRWRRL